MPVQLRSKLPSAAYMGDPEKNENIVIPARGTLTISDDLFNRLKDQGFLTDDGSVDGVVEARFPHPIKRMSRSSANPGPHEGPHEHAAHSRAPSHHHKKKKAAKRPPAAA